MTIPFNKPFLTGKEPYYIIQAVYSQKLSGNGDFTKKCHRFFEDRFGFKKVLLTCSCTDALEMAALLIDAKPGDEIIMPSYTFVSTANAFALRGCKIVFADSEVNNPNICPESILSLISPKTRAVVIVHYAGFACNMERICEIVREHKLYLIEDAAHAIDSYHQGRPLGSFGDLATFSFHETKNVISGEGGMLVVNNSDFEARADILWEKGTNRAQFFKGLVDKYTWVDLGSSFLPSELTAAFLFAQLENLDKIQERRKTIWRRYFEKLKSLASGDLVALPNTPGYSTLNGHIFYLLCQNCKARDSLLEYLKTHGITAVFHYIPLHLSPYYLQSHVRASLPNAEKFADTLIRLPLFFELSDIEADRIIKSVKDFFSHV